MGKRSWVSSSFQKMDIAIPFHSSAMRFAKRFLGFLMISGVGWGIDLVVYVLLIQILTFSASASTANFLSSMAGVTYVWGVALNRLFSKPEYAKSIFLPVYWTYQALSISLYSLLLSLLIKEHACQSIANFFMISGAVACKILLTPFNLMTNFIFMTLLTRFMQPNSDQTGGHQ